MCLTVVLAATIFSSSSYPQKQNIPVQPAGNPPIVFEDRQSQSRIDFVLNNSTTDDKPMIDSTLGGVALLDFDNDGFLDVFFTNGAQLPSLEKVNESFYNRLYRGNGDGPFKDVAHGAGVAGAGYSMGAAVGDYDNDGWVDLYVAGVNRNLLYHNNGDGTFGEVTEKAGVTGILASREKPWSVAAAWFDYNNDGFLDLFVVNYLDWSWTNNKLCGDPGKRLTCSPTLYKGLPNLLYRNNGDGTFTDVSTASGVGKHIGKGMGVAIADYDDNGFTDVFVANDNERNFLFRNLDGKSFAEVGVESGVAFTEDGVPVSSMGADFRDLNNDGRPDLCVTALGGETFPLFLNDGKGLFTDFTYQAGIGLATNTMSGWGIGAYDFDNDGAKDLFTANSHVSENVRLYGHHEYRQSNAVLRNQRDGSFRNVTDRAGLALAVASAHRGTAFGDLNNDGKVDIIVTAISDTPKILYNASGTNHHWILIQTIGRRSNRDGIGTKIRLTGESGLVQYNHVTTSVGYASSSDRRVHFGLGADRRIREIELRWPSGKVQVLKNIAADQILRVTEE
jgi:hypothetical protein